MWFLKLHIAVSVVYFITMIGAVTFFDKQISDKFTQLGRASNKKGIKKLLGNIKGITQFFLVSFVPIVRLVVVVAVFAIVFCDVETLDFLKKQEGTDDA